MKEQIKLLILGVSLFWVHGAEFSPGTWKIEAPMLGHASSVFLGGFGALER